MKGPSRLELLLRAPRLIRDPLPWLLECRARYGDVVSLPVNRPPGLILNNPADIRHVLATNSRNYRRSLNAFTRKLLGQGLFASEEPLHTQQRRFLQPWFQRQRIQSFVDSMQTTTERFLRGWQPGATIEVCRDMTRLTLSILVKIYLSADLDVTEELTTAFDVARRGVRQTIRVPQRIPLPGHRRNQAAIQRIHGLVLELIRARRETRDRPDDLLTALVESRNEHGAFLSDGEVRDAMVSIFLAGFETTTVALAWTFHLLAQHPDVEKRVHQEIDTVMGGRAARADDVAQLRYTGMVLSESMRLYPPVWALTRVAYEADRLDSGVEIPAGTVVSILPYVVHRDERFFPHPDTFDPLRFEPEAARARPPFAYFPFGGGPRGCIGEVFSLTESVIILANVGQRFCLRPAVGGRVGMEPLIVLRPKGGMMMRIQSREAGERRQGL